MKKIATIMTVFVLIFSMVNICFANAAEPPSIVIIVNDAPEDLSISLVDGELEEVFERDGGSKTAYFALYPGMVDIENGQLKLVTSDSVDYINIDSEMSYNNVFTLDYSELTLKKGFDITRSVIRVVLRVALTLIIEGLVFFLFGYREKASWIIFICINLVTQGWLNWWLVRTTPYESYGLFFLLIFAEFVIFSTEMLGLPILIKEKKKIRTIAFALVANMVSLIVGGLIIQALPI